jgi:23S rRNA pseudouridine1911/1915/1917 synthase
VRLDTYLQNQYPQVSRAQLQRLIKSGVVFVNGTTQTKAGYVVRESDYIALDHDLDTPPVIESIELPVLYEDEDCVVINKPVGILTHSKGAFNPEPTVATWLAERPNFVLPVDAESMRSGIVHRLDRATSGVMICAKNQKALKHLQKQFQDRKAKKTYVAKVMGAVHPLEALIDLPIERNPKEPQRFRVGQNGKASQTTYTVIEENDTASLLVLKPYTGRTHQLRVHLNYINHPIIGDTFYGGAEADRLYLHALSLEITLPSKHRDTFTAPLPKSFSLGK